MLHEEPAIQVLDLGSGGGVPGLVLAVEDPELRVLLLDANLRRTTFLEEALDRLGLTARVQVLRGRAEEIGRDAELRATFDVVVARGFATPAITAECAAPFLHVGGRLVVAEPPDSSGDRWNGAALETIGLAAVGIRHAAPTIMVLQQVEPCPDRYPRAKPGKRPLF